ncbi:helix-turn-helix domain-containing protein [Methanofollis ethanolicus]|uniref:helix-turn-helix domain-containing protein n=1 Tax=Methanofollis ethanolicus TaxID=488124 RepID=UPI00082E943E|nr:helix-turn-helix domain-containing protein [Methanofollis ethanolicus]
MKKDAVAYLTTRKRGDPEHQKEIIDEFCKYRFTVNKFFSDHRMTGTAPRMREGYQQMLEYARENRVEHLLFPDLPALAKNLEFEVEELRALVEEGFVPYFAKDDFFGYPDDPALRIMAVRNFVEYMTPCMETLKKAARTPVRPESGSRGTIGRPRALNDGQIEALITVRRSGTSISQICRMFSVSRSTVSKILAEYPELKGEWKGKRSPAEGAESE